MLLEEASSDKLSLTELISRLQLLIAGAALPAGIDSNVQRIETDRPAVQVMTVHMSKGLQADVVFLFGGIVRPPMPPRVCVYHDESRQRRIAVGATGRALGKAFLERELREENERLAYVALTRARVKLYLPVYHQHSTKRRVNGYYGPLNDRLRTLSVELDRRDAPKQFFEQVEVGATSYDPEKISAKVEERIGTWSPPADLIRSIDGGAPEPSFDTLRIGSRAMQTRSYTSLEPRRPLQSFSDIEPEEFKFDIESGAEDEDLRGGRRIGIFLHEAIEKLDLGTFEGPRDLSVWREHEDVRRVFVDAMRRNRVTDVRWFERGTEVVFNALTSMIAISPNVVLGPLYKRDCVREMEFVFPIPERIHSLLGSAKGSRWVAERGYLKGFVDFVFEHEGRHYFADWKSDFLTSYDRNAIDLHVREHYGLQAKIYAVGVVRLLGIKNKMDYDERFGGLLYLFIRGMKHDDTGDGVYFQRPDWAEICRYETALVGVVPEIESSR
jgi:exodeoxyribonuclease V beta subunit